MTDEWDDLTNVRTEWVVYRNKSNGWLDCESKQDWDRFLSHYPDHAKNFFELIATDLTYRQAVMMMKLSRSDE